MAGWFVDAVLDGVDIDDDDAEWMGLEVFTSGGLFMGSCGGEVTASAYVKARKAGTALRRAQPLFAKVAALPGVTITAIKIERDPEED